ncbi:putative quinol monooxygenase [Leifsonia poae]|uniref:putative quinol monooxygenase n=1 Tax=Leifsonia poae TaxID=110933 RepID=UPI003D664652
MSVTSLFDLRFAPDHLEDGPTALVEVLKQTRTFDGCIGVEIITDVDDPAHAIAIEHWESIEHDNAYRAWRAGDGASHLGTYLEGPAKLTRFVDVTAL